MAARTSAGVGVGVTITLLGVISLTLFVLTIVFLSKSQSLQGELKQLRTETDSYITTPERNQDDVRRLRDAAGRANQSLVAYLTSSMKNTMSRVTGAASDGMEQFNSKLDAALGGSGGNLLGALRDRDSQIGTLQSQLTQADADRTTALANLAAETERTKQLNASHQATITAMNSDIDKIKAEIEAYRQGTNQAKLEMSKHEGELTRKFEDERAALNENITKLQRESLIKDETIAKLRGTGRTQSLSAKDEFALVDGRVVGVEAGSNQVYIGLGEKDHVVLGLRFAVYNGGTSIQPDASGNYPRGKAELEVIRVGTDSSVARITSETAGNPIVKGDVIANAVYDPNKVYKFMVYGNFDSNGDGKSTAQEAEDVKATIKAWGGQIADDLVGDVDFLVLGSRPMMPPPPPSTAPIEVVREWQRLDQIARRYDELLKEAQATSMPILNENRLYTLTGKRAGLTAR